MRRFRPTLVAGALALAFYAGAASAQFSNAYFFGDSLSDSGNWQSTGVLPPGTGKFTINPGPVWTEVFASYYGFSATPSTQGGTNYAWGGAQVTTLPMVVGQPLNPLMGAPIVTQVQQFVAKGPADRNAIYSLFGGPNEVSYQLALLQQGLTTPSGVQAAVAQAAIALGTQAAILNGAGAKYIIVWGMPDLGTTLDGRASGLAPTLSALSSLFNNTLWSTLNATGLGTIRLNSAALLNEVLANPSLYGFTNTTAQACTVPAQNTIALCTASTLAPGANPNTWFWANGTHPTPGVHNIMAEYAQSVIVAPQEMAVLGQQPLDVEKANWRTLDGRMVSSINGKGVGKFEAWAAYDYGNPDYSSYQSGNANVNTIAVGGDMKVTDHLLIGVQFAYSESKTDYGTLSSKLKEPMGTFYVGYGEGPWYVGATLGAGGLDYSTDRSIPLGAAVRVESASPTGSQTVARLLGGYWFTYGSWLHGPTVKLTYQDITVRQFSENGSDSTTMTFGQQDMTSWQTSVGWQASGQIGIFRPFGRVTWEYNSENSVRNVSASVVNTGGGAFFSVPSYQPDSNYALFNLGATADFGGVTGYLTGSASAGKSDGNFWAITAGIRVPL
jgi:outer membrane lipase/esterase